MHCLFLLVIERKFKWLVAMMIDCHNCVVCSQIKIGLGTKTCCELFGDDVMHRN